jgi:riboflavin biosynthesis pyrimidine reductase
VRQVLPVTADPVDPNIVYADVPRATGRPGVRLNMIASVDGATSVNGVSGALGGRADHDVFVAMRAVADAVLVAAATVRTERYGPAKLPAETQDARRRRGQTAVPSIAVVTRSCELDWQSPFFTTAAVRPLIVTVAEAPGDRRARATEVADVAIAGERDVDLRRALAALDERGARAILAEGGPSLNAQLASAGLLDELCLTLSPAIVGGDAKRIVAGPALDPTPALDLRSVCEDDGYLFLRYRSKEVGTH